MKALFSVLSLLMMLAGCAPQGMRMVDAKDDAAFVSMYRAMKPAMQQKALVDRTGSWYEPLISTGPKDAGLVFLDRLSPKFCSAELNEPVVKSFRYMTVPGDQVKLDDWGASIRTAEYTVEIKLVAVTDWDGNGKDDWLAVVDLPRIAAAAALNDEINGKYGALLDNVRSFADAAKAYDNFGGKPAGVTSSVKFVYETAPIA